MSGEPLVFTDPFPHFLWFDALASHAAERIRGHLVERGGWAMQSQWFYDHWSEELRGPSPDATSPAWLASNLCDDDLDRLRRYVCEAFGAELSPHLQVLAHRMDRGQRIDVHNDAPVLGFETYRVVIYLDAPRSTTAGGDLRLHVQRRGRGGHRDDGDREVERDDGEKGSPVVRSITPEPGLAFGFAMHRGSLHSVSRLRSGVRHSLVVNMWHAGNSPATESFVRGALADISERPPDDAARRLSLLAAFLGGESVGDGGDTAQEQSMRAALLLLGWGFDEEVAAAAVLLGAPPAAAASPVASRLAPPGSPALAVRLRAGSAAGEVSRGVGAALWLSELSTGVFVPERWRQMQSAVGVPDPSDRPALRAAHASLFPEPVRFRSDVDVAGRPMTRF